MPKWFRNFYLTLLQYDDYRSSTNRHDFWTFNLTHMIILFTLFFFGSGVSIFTTFGLIYFVLCFPSSIALMVRRMNDIKESRWYLFLVLLPIIGWIYFGYLLVQPSKKHFIKT